MKAFRTGSKSWALHGDQLREDLGKLGPDFLSLADRLEAWVKRIEGARSEDGKIIGPTNLTEGLTDSVEAIANRRSPTRSLAQPSGEGARDTPLSEALINERLPEAKKLIDSAIRLICSRSGITKAMFTLDTFSQLKASLRASGVPQRVVDVGEKLWREQYDGPLPAYSELDLAMSAWLGGYLLLSSNTQRKPWIGGKVARLTHLVIDEVQDLSPSHVAVLASQLTPNGTMTLVGDLHQNLNPYSGLRSWGDLGLKQIARTSFGVNHRQTEPLGAFLQGLHEELFDEPCPWKPSDKMRGRKPRFNKTTSWDEIVKTTTQEVEYWRDTISGSSGATVAVLYDHAMERKRLRWLQRQLEVALSDQLISVEAAYPGSGSEVLRRTDRVVIASVRQAKGLEFDAVIFVEPRPQWGKPVAEISLRNRNGFYVAASRARAGLSLCMSNLPSCIADLAKRGLCVDSL